MSRFLTSSFEKSYTSFTSNASSFSCKNSSVIISRDTVISVSFLLRVLVLVLIVIIRTQFTIL